MNMSPRRQDGPPPESVWDYPRPPRLERTDRRLLVTAGAVVIADTVGAFRVLETSHPPSYYLPPGDCDLTLLSRSVGSSFCEWKGSATYWDVTAGGRVVRRASWSYPDPTAAFEPIRDHLAFYPSLFECYVDGERVAAQPGGFYGGWVTSDLLGPFKGSAGTQHW